MDPDKRNAWLRKLDEECPYQVVLPRRGTDETAILNFLSRWVGKFDMYVEDDMRCSCVIVLKTRSMRPSSSGRSG